MVIKNRFQLLILWWPKIGGRRVSNFRLPTLWQSKIWSKGWFYFQKWYYMHFPFFGDRKILVAIWDTPIVEWWPKGVGPLSLLGNRRISITIQWCGFVEWQTKFFGYRPMMWICQMVIKFFQLPSYTPPLSDGDQMFFYYPKGHGGRPWNDIKNKGREKKWKKRQ